MTGVDALRARLWTALADGDEQAATALLLDAGLDAETVLLDVIAPTQARIGAEWADNRLTVAQEHWMTAINDRVIAALSHRKPPGEHRGRVTVACVDGEWHALPARLLAETLRLRGWQVDYLGAQVPPNHLIAHLHQRGPDALALSSSIPTRLPVAHATITACQATGVPVIAGGAAFGVDGRYAHLLGADAWAPDARTAAERLARLGPRDRTQGQVLPHLLDQEYTMVARTLPQLVKQALVDVENAIPQVRAYTDQQRQHAAEDIARLVDFLATSLYVDDDAIFTEHVAWTDRVLTARGVPSAVLSPTLDSLATQLADFPRASRCLRGARSTETNA